MTMKGKRITEVQIVAVLKQLDQTMGAVAIFLKKGT
jgi:hypothetical protein